MVSNLPEILCTLPFLNSKGEKPLLVFNDTKVRKARLIGKSLDSDAWVEFLLLENVGNVECGIVNVECGMRNVEWKVLVKRSKRRKVGSWYGFFDSDGVEVARAEIIREDEEFKYIRFNKQIDDLFLDKYGHVPLPPYIKRNDSPADTDRYQTIYAKKTGSAAAPTAGLHFTRELLDSLERAGIETAFITLHVGLGTFLPVRKENIEEHKMHSETFNIDEQTALKIEKAKQSGRKIIAVGTTSVRTLESAWKNGQLNRGENSTSIFIYPGYQFNVINALFTNFHTPESTLLMLVSAFAGRELIMKSYEEAVKEKYRFFSYGDAMLIY